MTHSVSLSNVIMPEMMTMMKYIISSNMISTFDPEMHTSPTLNDSINTILDQNLPLVMSFVGL